MDEKIKAGRRLMKSANNQLNKEIIQTMKEHHGALQGDSSVRAGASIKMTAIRAMRKERQLAYKDVLGIINVLQKTPASTHDLEYNKALADATKQIKTRLC